MKDAKKTKVRLPGPNKQAKAQRTPSKTQLSHEFIGSDDDSSAETTPKPKPKPKTTIGVHGANGAVKHKEKLNSKAKAVPKKAASTQVATQAQAAELSTSEQTDDDDDDDDAPARDIQTKLPGNKRRASVTDSASSLESSSDESDVHGTSQTARKPSQEYVMPRIHDDMATY
jgi:hypothetical protein